MSLIERLDPGVAMLDRLPAEELKPPKRFELYQMLAVRMTEITCRVPPSRERDDVLSRLRDALVRNAIGPEPRLQ
jgi:hypothetical protein